MNFSMLGAGGIGSWWILAIMLVLIVGMYVVAGIKRKKYSDETQQMLNELKVGSKVKTYGGLYGTIVLIKETSEGKVALIEMGEGKRLGYATVDINAVVGIDEKKDVVYDVDGNVKSDKDDKNSIELAKIDEIEEQQKEKEFMTTEERKAKKQAEKERKAEEKKLKKTR